MTDPFQKLTPSEIARVRAQTPATSNDQYAVVMPVPARAGEVADEAGTLTGLRRRPDKVWHYTSEAGDLLFAVARWNMPNGGKEIRPFCWARDTSGREGWRSIHAPSPRPLFGLDKLAGAKRDGWVVVVEGEKAADAAASLFSEPVVTSAGGSAAADKSDWTPLHGRKVIIWPDADEPGRKYAMTVAKGLAPHVAKIRMFDAPALAALIPGSDSLRDAPAGWDAADAVAEGWTRDFLRSVWTANSKELDLDALRAEPIPPRQQSGSVILKRAADVVSEPIDWLWRHYLAKGKLHLLGGAPSAGKTTLACWFAAAISKGGSFPGGSKAPGGTVLVWSGEDAIADTLKPRLEAAGANLDRIHFIDGVSELDGPRAFDPARDITNLERAVQELGDVALLVLDPVVSAVAGDGHKSNDVRRALQPIVDMVGRNGVAALGITHFSKGTSGRDPTERITGSVAFGALARVVLVAAKEVRDIADDSPGDTRIFTRAKSNIGPDGGGFRYAIEQVELSGGITTTKAVWGEPLSGTARELLGQAETEAEQGGGSGAAIDEAVNFLLSELATGAVAVKELERSASDAGITKATLRRACEKVGVKKERSGFGKGGSWVAFIPGTNSIGAHETPKVLTPERMSAYGNSEHLWANGADIEL